MGFQFVVQFSAIFDPAKQTVHSYIFEKSSDHHRDVIKSTNQSTSL